MNLSPQNSLPLSSYPNTGPKSLTYAVDMKLVYARSSVYAADMLLQVNIAKTYAVDMVLQGANADFYGVDMILADPNHDNGPWHMAVGNGLTQPIDPNRLAVWSTYSRPANPVDGQTGVNKQTFKLEYWSEKQARWNNYDGTAA